MRLWNYIKSKMEHNLLQTVSENDTSLTFEEMIIFAEEFSKNLKGIKCCAIMCQSEMAASMVLLSCFAAEVTTLPISQRYETSHCKKILKTISPDVVITDQDGEFQIFHIKDSKYKEPTTHIALIMCTSGTTGVPKDAMLTETNIITNVSDIAFYFKIDSSDTILISRPLYHCAVLTGEFLTSLVKGTKIYFYSGEFNPIIVYKMETNNKTISSEEEITLANTRSSGIQIIGDIDPYFDDTIALPATDTIHEKIVFNDEYLFKKSYTVTGEVVSLYLDTDGTLEHEGGKDGAYSFKFSSPDTQLSCEFIDTDDWTSVGENHGDSVNLAMLLPDKKLYKIKITPDDMQNSVTINVEISYTIYRNIGQISIDKISKGTAVRVNDRFTMHFRNSIENNCTWRSSNPSVVSVGYTSGQLTAHKLGSATITFTNPCGTSYSTVVRCVLDHVYITPDGTGYNKVAFGTSGRIWHCVYRDTIYESPQNIANTILFSVTQGYITLRKAS